MFIETVYLNWHCYLYFHLWSGDGTLSVCNLRSNKASFELPFLAYYYSVCIVIGNFKICYLPTQLRSVPSFIFPTLKSLDLRPPIYFEHISCFVCPHSNIKVKYTFMWAKFFYCKATHIFSIYRFIWYYW